MRERPILFNGDMVRAILEGRKTVTRRAMKAQPVLDGGFWKLGGAGWSKGISSFAPMPGYSLSERCPFGRPGDRLWVRETTEAFRSPCGATELSRYAADGAPVLHPDLEDCEFSNSIAHWTCSRSTRPSIHMPRWASRILLEITAVRVERLQDITEEQAIAEGIDLDALVASQDRYDMVLAGSGADGRATPITAFRDLWNSTGGDWDANPWVWVVEFKRLEARHA